MSNKNLTQKKMFNLNHFYLQKPLFVHIESAIKEVPCFSLIEMNESYGSY